MHAPTREGGSGRERARDRTAAHVMTLGENAPTLARAAAGQLRLDVGLGEGHLRGHAVNDAAHTFAVGLAVRGHAEVLAPGRHRGGEEKRKQ